MPLEALVSNPACKRLRTLVACLPTRRRRHHTAAFSDKQPFLGRTPPAPHGERRRKGRQNKARLLYTQLASRGQRHFHSGRTNMKSNPKKSKLDRIVACWNVRTMLDKTESSLPKCLSALLTNRHSSSQRGPLCWRMQPQRERRLHHLHPSWTEKPSVERSMSGVGLMVRNSIASKLETLPTGHSD